MSSETQKAGEFFADRSRKLIAAALLCAAFTCLLLWTTAATAQASTEDGEVEESALTLEEAAGSTIPVSITIDDERKVVVVEEGSTVADVLDELDIELSITDFLTPSLETVVSEFGEITLLRREYGTFTMEYEIPYQVIYRYSPEVRAGTQVVETTGQPGSKVETFVRYTSAGAVHEEVLISSEIEKEPVDEVILTGFKSTPVSDLDFDWEFDDNGEPIGYTNVVRSGKASGYTASTGASTASGKPAVVGHVAVNPNVIPYGSKLFIQSPGGDFIYGYAIAADTGGALVANVVQVDLFYDTYAESAANGIREVDIFVLD